MEWTGQCIFKCAYDIADSSKVKSSDVKISKYLANIAVTAHDRSAFCGTFLRDSSIKRLLIWKFRFDSSLVQKRRCNRYYCPPCSTTC